MLQIRIHQHNGRSQADVQTGRQGNLMAEFLDSEYTRTRRSDLASVLSRSNVPSVLPSSMK